MKIVKPAQQPCKICKYYADEYCFVIDDNVKPFRTGCVRWKSKQRQQKGEYVKR